MQKARIILAIVAAAILIGIAFLFRTETAHPGEYHIIEQRVVTSRVEPAYTGATIFVVDKDGEEYEFKYRDGVKIMVINCCAVGIEYIMQTALTYNSERDKWFIVEQLLLDIWDQDMRPGGEIKRRR